MENGFRKLGLALICLLSFNAITLASHFKGSSEVVINSRLDANAYLAGGTVSVSAPIEGDLLCGGGDITVSDTIFDDAFIGGGNIDITGIIMGDLRIAGGNVYVNNQVGGDLIIASGDVTVGADAFIGGDIILAGGNSKLLGTVKGNMKAYGGNFILDGKVEGDAEIKYGNIELNGEILGDAVIAANQIDLGLNPALHGRVEYWTRNGEMDFGSTLKSDAELVYNPALKFTDSDFNYNNRGSSSFGFWIWRILSATLFIALMSLLFGGFFERIGEELPEKMSNKALMGAAYFIGFPVAIIMLFITVIGIPIGFFGLFFYIFSIAFTKATTATVGAYTTKYFLDKDWGFGMIILVGLGIYLLLSFINLIPVFGWLMVFAAALIAFGAIIMQFQTKRPTPTQDLV